MRNFKTLALVGVIGVFALASDASACHKKKCACPTTTTVVACAPAPVVECAPVKKKCFSMPKVAMPKIGCHKKAVATCAAPVGYAAPVAYAAPSYASPQASAQASGQGM